MHFIDDQPFNIQGVHVIPIRAMHMHLPVLGFRINNFTYITDANHISTEERKKIAGSEIIVVNGLRKQKHISHFNLSEAIALIQEARPKHGYITHISHQMGLHKEIQAEMPDNISLAYDGLVVEL